MIAGVARVHLTVMEPDSASARKDAMKQALSDLGVDSETLHHIHRDTNGKPHLHLAGQEHVGYSLSKAHLKPRKIALQALQVGQDIGIDIEHWPQRPADPAFLATIAADADHNAIEILARSGSDGSVALWVIKEAALKLTGAVMVDPRDIAVMPKANGGFFVRSLLPSGVTQLEAHVSLFILNTIAKPDLEFVVGLAQPPGDDRPNHVRNLPFLQAFGWKLAYYAGY